MIDVKKVASLARLAITESEELLFQKQLSSIMSHFEEISAIDTQNIEPLVTPSEIEVIYRNDEKEIHVSVEEALMNAPERSGNLFKVPPVV